MEPEVEVMKISMLAKLSGLSSQLIHYYLRKGYLHPPIYKKSNQALYDKTHLERLEYLKKYQKRGIPLYYAVQLLEKESRAKAVSDQQVSHCASDSNTRKQIIDAALQLFLYKGYRNTSILDIVKEVNLTKPAFYYYFKNKKELYFACLDNLFLILQSKELEGIKKETNPLKRLEKRGRAATEQAFYPKLHTALQLIKESLWYEDEEQKQKAAEMLRKAWVQPIAKDLERGVKSGMFRPLNSEIVSVLLLSLIDAFAYSNIFEGAHSSRKIMEEAYHLILEGIMARS